MIYIAHRGNLRGSDPDKENTLTQIQKALRLNFEVEIDVWCKGGKWFLGHDEPQEPISLEFLDYFGFWVHCKNFESLEQLSLMDATLNLSCNYFWHEKDQFTLTSKRLIWTYPGGPIGPSSIVLAKDDNYSDEDLLGTLGICSDNIMEVKERLEKLYGDH